MRQADDSTRCVTITSEMLKAGIEAASLFRLTEDDYDLFLPHIYSAMRLAEHRDPSTPP